MTILFNFHILLATFYTIFGTNILIQCPVPVPVCCMFLVPQNIHIKWSPNGIKTDGAYFWKIWKIRKENQREPVPEVVTRQGACPPLRARPLPRGPLEHRLSWFFLPKNHIYSKKISVSFYPVWTPFDMDILRNKKHATNRNWHLALGTGSIC